MGNVAQSLPGLRFDEDGFLLDPMSWTREAAERIAREDGIGPLSEDHWHVVYYIREHYLSYGTIPSMSHVCWVLSLKKHAVQDLFTTCLEAWRVAGLPNPGEEAKAYM